MLPDITGELITGGFFRLHAVAHLVTPSVPEPIHREEVATAETLADLLDDLDRISPYIPPALLSRIIAAPDQPQVEADLRPVTALFAQVVGLEALAEVLPSVQSARIFERYMIAMQSAIAHYGGVINKLDVAEEGVKLLAIFGAPTAYEDHSERGARAALAMQSALSRVNAEIEAQLSSTDDSHAQSSSSSIALLRQRIGLNPGVVFAGNVGGANRKEYTVMGDAVNIAARVMSAAPWGDIWCSRALAETTARIICEPQGAITLKGKAEPLEICRIAGERESGEATLLFQGGLTPLVDREREMAWLGDRLDAALAGSGRAVRLVGEAGVGKSQNSSRRWLR